MPASSWLWESGAVDSAGGARPAEAVTPVPKGPELPGLRTRSSRTFEGPDGSRVAEVYPDAVNYRDGDGDWQPIDNRLVASAAPGYAFENAANRWSVRLPRDLGGAPIRVGLDGSWATFALEGAAGEGSASGNEMRYPGVLPGVTARYTATSDALKEELVLAGADAPSTYRFALDLSAGLTPREKAGGGIEFVDRTGRAEFAIAPAFMVDAAGEHHDVELELLREGAGYTVVARADRRWLDAPGRRFPVTVDPTFDFSGAALPSQVQAQRDCFIDSSTPTTTYCGWRDMDLGRGHGGNHRPLLQFPVETAIPAGVEVLDAEVDLYVTQNSGSGGIDVSLHRVTQPWNSDATWLKRNLTDAWTSPGGDFESLRSTYATAVGWQGPGHYFWQPNELVQAWVNREQPNHGLLLKTAEGSDHLLTLARTGVADQSKWPALRVTYEQRIGERGHWVFHKEHLWDGVDLSVNVASGNLMLYQKDLEDQDAGLEVGRYYNNLSSHWSESGRGWRLKWGSEIGLQRFFDQTRGTSPVLYGPSGSPALFQVQPDGSYLTPEGVNASLVKNTDGTYALTYDSGEEVFFDARGWLTAREDPSGKRTSYTIDADGNLAKITDALGRETTFVQNADEHVTSMREPGGGLHTYGVTAGKLSTYTTPDGKITRYDYDAALNLTQLTDPDGSKFTFAYDSQRRVTRMTRVTDPGTGTGPTTTFEYLAPATPCDPAKYVGMTRITPPAGEATLYCHDGRGRGDEVIPDQGLSGPLEAAGQQPGTDATASAYELDVHATDQGERQRGMRRIEVLVDGQVVHDSGTQPCDAGGCSMDTEYVLRPQMFAPGERTVDVVTTDQVKNVRRTSRPIKVPSEPSNTAGLEEWFQYDSVETGADTRAHVNLSTGNLVWQGVPVVNMGRGLSTFVTLTYNSADKGGLGQHEGGIGNEADGPNYKQVGQNFSLGVSGMTRLNEPLVVSNDTGGIVTLYDADGTRHRFDKSPDGVTFDPPPGVNLHLRKFSLTNFARSWAITRPDGVTYFFDRLGYQREIVDRNGNVMRFDYEPLPNANEANCTSPKTPADLDCKKRVIRITDSAGVVDVPAAPSRSIEVRYYPQTVPAADGDAAGRIKEIVDHAGRVTAFSYDDRGFLIRLTEAQGTADQRAFVFGYEGEGQERNLSTIRDPRGATTQVFYEQRGGPMRRVVRIANRRAKERLYSYDTLVQQGAHFELATVKDARGFDTNYKMDGFHRPVEIVDPLGTKTTLRWDLENKLTRVIDAAGTADEAITLMTYNLNGLPRTHTDGNGHTTTMGYRNGPGLQLSELGTDVGKDFVSDLTSLERPKGNTWTFVPDSRGNVTEVKDHDGFFSTATYDARGQITEEVDEVGNKTTYPVYDPNGLPRLVVDPRGNEAGANANEHRWIFRYDVVGNLVARTDPRGATTGGVDDPRTTFTATFTYDALDRLKLSRTPKLSMNGEYIERQHRYDANGNLVELIDGNGKSWTYSYTPMDDPAELRSPAVTHAGETDPASEVTRFTYDAEDNLDIEIAPNKDTTTVAAAYSTRFVRDALGRVTAAVRRSREVGRSEDIVTSYAYDRRDNVIGLMDPEGNRRAGGDPSANAKNAAIRRFTFQYDKADNRRFAIEEPGRRNFVTETTYDDNDNVSGVIDPRGDKTGNKPAFTTAYEYDDRDLLTKTIEPGGATTQYVLRGDGKLEKLIKPNGFATAAVDGDFTTVFTYFPTGEVKTRSIPFAQNQYGPRNWKVTYERNPVGDPERITDARGNVVISTFLDTGDVRTTDRPSWWGFDPGTADAPAETGEIVETGPQNPGREQRTDQLPSSEAKNDFGDVLPHPLPGIVPRAGLTTFAYDGELRLRAVTNGPVTKTLSRDAVGRIASVTYPFDGARQIVNEFRFDRNGNLRETVDGENKVRSTVFDQFDRPVEEHSPGANEGPETTLYGYDANDNLRTVQTPRGPIWRMGYDTLDRLDSEKNPLGDEWTFGYDEAGNQTSARSPRGNTVGLPEAERPKFATRRTFDARNLVTSIKNGLQPATTIAYDPDGNPTTITRPGAKSDPGATVEPQVTELSYDGRDLEWTRTTGTGVHKRTTVTEFDANGNLRRTVNPFGVDPTTGRPKWPDGGGTVSATSDANRHATVNTYNPDDLVVRIDLPWGQNLFDGAVDARRYRQRIIRDGRGRITQSESVHRPDVDPQAIGHRTTYTYFDTDWVKTSIDPSLDTPDEKYNQALDYDYDKRGLQIRWHSDKRNRTVTRSFWDNGLLQQRIATAEAGDGQPADDRRYEYRWNRNGSLTKFIDHEVRVDDPGRATEIVYDDAERQRVVNELWSRGRDTTFSYDPNGNLLRRQTDGRLSDPKLPDSVYSGGRTTAFIYDELDRETKTIVCPQGGPTCTQSATGARTTTSSYFDSDQLATEIKSNGLTEERFYFNDGRLSRMRRQRPGATAFAKDRVYAYDADGNRTKDERGDFGFNARDQLVYWKRSPTRRLGDSIVNYTVDGAGRIEKLVDGGRNETREFQYENDRLDRETVNGTATFDYDYDRFGSLTSIAGGGVNLTFTYDAFERLTRSSADLPASAAVGTEKGGRYEYDALDRRDRKVTTHKPVSGADEERSFDFSYVGLSDRVSRRERAGVEALRFDYDSGLDRLGFQGATEYKVYGIDASGSVEELQDGDDGAVLSGERYFYDPFGALEPQQDPPAGTSPEDHAEAQLTTDARQNPFRFQGFYYDAGIRAYDMEAREYLPRIGRFMSQDRFEDPGLDLELQTNPLTKDRYLFGAGNPVDNIEYDGHKACTGTCEPGEYMQTASGEVHRIPGAPSSAAADAVQSVHVAPERLFGGGSAGSGASRAPAPRPSLQARRCAAAASIGALGGPAPSCQPKTGPDALEQFVSGVRSTTEGMIAGAREYQAMCGEYGYGSTGDCLEALVPDPKALKDSCASGTFMEAVGSAGTCIFGAWVTKKVAGPARTPGGRDRRGADNSTSGSGAAKGADDIGGAGRTAARACSFSGDITVLMADGSRKPIEEVKVGDKVMASDPETRERVAKRVTHVWVHDDTVIDLVVDGDVITTTEDHPFWSVTDQRFERADHLTEGELLLGAGGRAVKVSRLRLRGARASLAYNLSVQGIHTYHVGNASVLVHNSCYSSIDALNDPKALEGLTPGQVDDLARNAGFEVLPGKASAANPATRYYVPGTNRSVGFRVLPGGVAGQSGVKGGPYLRYFGGPRAGQRVRLNP